MYNAEMLDRMSFDDLSETLRLILEEIDKIGDEADGRDDPRLDIYYVAGNAVITRMDSIIRRYARERPEVLARWEPMMERYRKGFENYEDILLEEDTLLDIERPKKS